MYTLENLDKTIEWLKKEINHCEWLFRQQRGSSGLRMEYAGYKAQLDYLEGLRTELNLQ